MALARDLGYLSDEIYNAMILMLSHIGKQLNNYIAYLNRSSKEKNFPRAILFAKNLRFTSAISKTKTQLLT